MKQNFRSCCKTEHPWHFNFPLILCSVVRQKADRLCFLLVTIVFFQLNRPRRWHHRLPVGSTSLWFIRCRWGTPWGTVLSSLFPLKWLSTSRRTMRGRLILWTAPWCQWRPDQDFNPWTLSPWCWRHPVDRSWKRSPMTLCRINRSNLMKSCRSTWGRLAQISSLSFRRSGGLLLDPGKIKYHNNKLILAIFCSGIYQINKSLWMTASGWRVYFNKWNKISSAIQL